MINETKKRDASPLDHLGKPGMARRISEVKSKPQRSSVGEPATHNGLDVGSIPAAGTKSKRGRPAKVADDEPWKAEGVSRRTWYRQQKKDDKRAKPASGIQ